MIFLSYKSEEYDITKAIKTMLEANHYPCWMAPESIPAGSNYMSEIPKAIRSCDLFVLIVSERSQQSPWVQKEIDRAVKFNKYIVPFQVDDSPLIDAIEFVISNNQRIDAHNRLESALDELLLAVRQLHPPVEAEEKAEGEEASNGSGAFLQMLGNLPPEYLEKMIAGYRSSDAPASVADEEAAPAVNAAPLDEPAVFSSQEVSNVLIEVPEEVEDEIEEEEPTVTEDAYYDAYPDAVFKGFRISRKGILHGYKSPRKYRGDVVIPYGVKVIASDAFSKRKRIKRVIVPPTVEIIQQDAFRECEELECVIFYNGVQQIGNHAFRGCRQLQKMDLPKSLHIIGDFAFYDCYPAKISLQKNVSFIGIAAFNGCTQVKIHPQNADFLVHSNCIISNKDNSIVSAFQDCSFPKLRRIKTVGQYAFYGCISLQDLHVPNFITRIEPYAFSKCYNITELTVESSVESLGSCCFADCNNLQSVTLKHGVSIIESFAFQNCRKIKRIIIPPSVNYASKDAFDGCPHVNFEKIHN